MRYQLDHRGAHRLLMGHMVNENLSQLKDVHKWTVDLDKVLYVQILIFRLSESVESESRN